MLCGRSAGASLAFPLLIHAESLLPFTGVIIVLLVLQALALAALRGDIERLA